MRGTTLHRTTTVTAVAAAALLVVGCGAGSGAGSSGSGATPPSAPPASSAPVPPSAPASPSLPPTPTGTGCAPEVQLTAADTGRTVCLAQGGRIRIALDGSKDRPWAVVAARGDALEATNAGIAVPPGDALTAFEAVAPGTAWLTSSRPLCARQPGRNACLGIEQWTVTVTVTAP
ncbi:hypothetical protein PV336_25680 [Streptomyces sp. MI02-2A]|uniref:hypothetical protein n=1 Tax=Streptomyces sp. MI02-2A TaxID=3028688 RepID=UPI0029AFDE3A|nr:hypothetical protein [Streptomyces sp. MI02-2A]MDX3262577.1 hypothetical protein [Streptomyces sp. MI02-2A]